MWVCGARGQSHTAHSLFRFAMTTTEVYSPTTASNPKLSWFRVPSEHLDKTRFGIKLCEVVSSNTCHSVWCFQDWVNINTQGHQQNRPRKVQLGFTVSRGQFCPALHGSSPSFFSLDSLQEVTERKWKCCNTTVATCHSYYCNMMSRGQLMFLWPFRWKEEVEVIALWPLMNAPILH